MLPINRDLPTPFGPARTTTSVNPDTSKKYDDYRYTAIVDANGAYTVSIPAKNNGSKVRIIQDYFTYATVVASSTTIRTIYKGPAMPVETTVYRGTVQVMDLFY